MQVPKLMNLIFQLLQIAEILLKMVLLPMSTSPTLDFHSLM